MDFYSLAGKMALGSRLRRLSDSLLSDAGKLYEFYDVNIDSKWFPVFYMLSHKEQASITDIAKDIGHTHPSVSNIVKEMVKANIVSVSKSKEDSRVTVVKLTAQGKQLCTNAEDQYLDVDRAIGKIQTEAGIDLFRAVEQIEIQLENNNFFDRVRTERKIRESDNIIIIEYSSKYQPEFAKLNIEWIEQYWEMEETDHNSLNDPEGYILNSGGFIYLALYKGEVVGSCALLNQGKSVFELAKMAVTPKEKGKGIGFLLGEKIIDKAVRLEAEKIYLESNTLLKPAICLYKKLGFIRTQGVSSPYERCNIYMELEL